MVMRWLTALGADLIVLVVLLGVADHRPLAHARRPGGALTATVTSVTPRAIYVGRLRRAELDAILGRRAAEKARRTDRFH
jgi:hypothetical protein